MIKEHTPLVQALLGTFFTWAMTAAGALMVIFFKGTQPKLLDTSLGFAAGVMTAASYWSLLAPAINMAQESGLYGENGRFAFIPACVGFLLGASFTFAADILISRMGIESPNLLLGVQNLLMLMSLVTAFVLLFNVFLSLLVLAQLRLDDIKKTDGFSRHRYESSVFVDSNLKVGDSSLEEGNSGSSGARRRAREQPRHPKPSSLPTHDAVLQWKRILLLIIAITVHNVPEGLAVGVGFGAIGSTNSAEMFHSARNLAIGIGIQNFPEGLAVSLPLKAAGFSTFTSFWYGQLSGMVEPVFGLIGALLVTAAQPVLPYALAFAAGAMIYVVVDDIIPEANTKGNGCLASWGAIFGFMVMMMLEVGLQ